MPPQPPVQYNGVNQSAPYPGQYQSSGQTGFPQPLQQPTHYPGAGMQTQFSNMSISPQNSFNNQSSSPQPVNLLANRHILPSKPLQPINPKVPEQYKGLNCDPTVFRCTLNAIPQKQEEITKAKLPFGLLIHPFKDLQNLPVIQSPVIVRCKSCRTYINPFVSFIDQRRWKCNMCFRTNEGNLLL